MAMVQPIYRTLGSYIGEQREIEALQSKVSEGVLAIKEELSAAYSRIEELEGLLGDIREYFEHRSDVKDGDYGVPEPNEEMKMLQRMDEVIP
jgi:hypothetical protein